LNFVDPSFLMALPIFLGIYFIIKGSLQKWWLLLASTFFYAWCSPEYTLLLLVSTLVDYSLSLWMEHKKYRRWLIGLSVIFNLGLLAYFKYVAFLWNSAWIPVAHGLGFEPPALGAVLPPVGISFFTFQTMSYTIDVYRGHLKATRSFLDFATYVSMFPQLVAGPIVRAKDLLGQIDGQRRCNWDNIRLGGRRFAIGFAKKACLADALGITFVDSVYSNPDQASPMALILAMLAYSFQIYYDFSGYSDMAIGLGKIMGYDFPENFNHPYRAQSFSDFWSRWHISLSSWLRDYLYIPLGGNRGGGFRTSRNLMLTMLLGGLWHGASWLFVVWGALHGLALILQRFGQGLVSAQFRQKIPAVLKLLCVFALVTLIWVPFRAAQLSDCVIFWKAPMNVLWQDVLLWLSTQPEQVILLGLAFGLHYTGGWLSVKCYWKRWPLALKGIIWASLGFWLLNFYPQNSTIQPFIYFQF
jgi:alginate O-acetyltransferase complex protein AlgI